MPKNQFSKKRNIDINERLDGVTKMKVIKNNHRILALLFLIALFMVSCSSPQQTDGVEESPEEMAPAEGEVVMQGITFQPPEITVQVGTAVTWVNEDSVSHTVTSGTRGEATGEFDASVAPGESFSFTFEEAGRFDYFCSIHPGMDGSVIAEE